MPIGARQFCANCDSIKKNEPIAQGHKFGATKAEYQEAVTMHFTDNHPDLHYPVDQDALDAKDARNKARRARDRTKQRNAYEQAMITLARLALEDEAKHSPVEGGLDLSGRYQPVSRPRELPDFTEFDFPDAAVADDGVEEIEFDQLISIQARQGRRLLGIELQNLDVEMQTEFLTAPDNADLDLTALFELNTRTGGFNLDDPENLWRARYANPIANVEATAGTGTAITAEFFGENDLPPGGRVYVAPRLFWRFTNALDRQVDAGDLFSLIATINQPLGTFLLFELLEQYSGLFGLT